MFRNLVLLAGLVALVPATEAAFPGGNGRISLDTTRDANDEVYAINPDGSDPVRLTNDAAFDGYSAWSPDGTRIAFVSQRDGNAEIYVMNADGSNPVRLTDNAAGEERPAWSPDGSRIAFSSNRDGDLEIYVMGADGSNPVPLTDNPATDRWPAWSPDGTRIAFESNRDGNSEIYVMGADGSNPVRLTTNTAGDRWVGWSPDGTRLVLYSNRDGNDEIYVMNADGSNPVRLTTNSVADRWPAWSPDGSRIAFTSNRDGNLEAYVMNADGSNPVRLTTGPADDLVDDWQPVAPANDARAEARVIGQGQFPGALALATPDGSASCVAGEPQPDIWFRYSVPMAGRLRVNTCGTNDLGVADVGSDTVLSLHTADGAGEFACNDDWPSSAAPAACAGTDTGLARDSYLQAYVPASQDVLVRVSRFPNGGPLRAVVVNLDFLPDTDGDGTLDDADNCTLLANPGQCDSDADGYGNRCDGDLNNNQFTNAQDATLFRQQLGQPSVSPVFNKADLNCNGFVNAQDATLFRGLLQLPPGPSGLAP